MLKAKIHRFIERFVEIVFSLFFLLTVFPLVYIVVAIVVKRCSPGPAVVLRPRRRADGCQYLSYRFRLRNEESFVARMPQLINILLGDSPIHLSVSMDVGEEVVESIEEPIVEPINTNIDNDVDIQ